MLSPLRLGNGPTILDELERYREYYRVLSNKYSIPRVDPEFRYLQGDLVQDRQPETSIIVLNRDGENHLELFFSSYLKHHETGRLEIVIVDHGSKDGSLKVIEKYMGILPIKFIAFTQNHSERAPCRKYHLGMQTLISLRAATRFTILQTQNLCSRKWFACANQVATSSSLTSSFPTSHWRSRTTTTSGYAISPIHGRSIPKSSNPASGCSE